MTFQGAVDLTNIQTAKSALKVIYSTDRDVIASDRKERGNLSIFLVRTLQKADCQRIAGGASDEVIISLIHNKNEIASLRSQ